MNEVHEAMIALTRFWNPWPIFHGHRALQSQNFQKLKW